jgi:hypothetical protein
MGDSSSEDDTLDEARTLGKCSLRRAVASSIRPERISVRMSGRGD